MENQEQSLKLHPEARFISFKHKTFFYETFKRNLQGAFGIDYFSLMVVDSLQIISSYSTSPAFARYHFLFKG